MKPLSGLTALISGLAVQNNNNFKLHSTTSNTITANYLGCYLDSSNRVLPNFLLSNGNPTTCGQAALDAGYVYYGLEYYGECWASNTQPTITSNNCNAPCNTDTTVACGGSWALSAYHINTGSSNTPAQTSNTESTTPVTTTTDSNTAPVAPSTTTSTDTSSQSTTPSTDSKSKVAVADPATATAAATATTPAPVANTAPQTTTTDNKPSTPAPTQGHTSAPASSSTGVTSTSGSSNNGAGFGFGGCTNDGTGSSADPSQPWLYIGNVGSPYGSNIIQIAASDINNYYYTNTFVNGASISKTIGIWNKAGSDGQPNSGMYQSPIVQFNLSPGSSQTIAFDINSQVGFAALINGAQQGATWGELNTGLAQSDSWTGFDISQIQGNQGNMKLEWNGQSIDQNTSYQPGANYGTGANPYDRSVQGQLHMTTIVS